MKKPFYNFEGKLATEPIVSFLRQVGSQYNGRMVDIGCGKMPYKMFFPSVESYVGIDRTTPNAAMEGTFVSGDINNLPFNNSEFDVALLTQVIEHVPDPGRLLKEVCRILAINGALILTAPQMGRLHEEPNDYFRYTKYGLIFLLESEGFEIKLIQPHGGFWRALGSHFNFYLISTLGKNKILKSAVRILAILPINLLAKVFDRIFYWNLDTLGYNVIAIKKEGFHG